MHLEMSNCCEIPTASTMLSTDNYCDQYLILSIDSKYVSTYVHTITLNDHDALPFTFFCMYLVLFQKLEQCSIFYMDRPENTHSYLFD